MALTGGKQAQRPQKRIRAEVIGQKTGYAGRREIGNRHRVGARIHHRNGHAVTAIPAKPPQTLKAPHVRHLQVQRHYSQIRRLIRQHQRVGKARGGHDDKAGIRSRQMVLREVAAEAVFKGQQNAHPYPLFGSRRSRSPSGQIE